MSAHCLDVPAAAPVLAADLVLRRHWDLTQTAACCSLYRFRLLLPDPAAAFPRSNADAVKVRLFTMTVGYGTSAVGFSQIADSIGSRPCVEPLKEWSVAEPLC